MPSAKHHEIDAREARRLVGKAIFGDDWIGSLSKKELDLLSGPHGPQRKWLTNGRPVTFISPCRTAGLRKKLDVAIGRAQRAILQDATVWDVMHDNGFYDTLRAFDRARVEDFLKKVRVRDTEIGTRPIGKPRDLIEGIILKMASDLRSGIDVDSMRGKEMAVKYGGSRNTCTNARKELHEKLARK